jgi:hypothetical protein
LAAAGAEIVGLEARARLACGLGAVQVQEPVTGRQPSPPWGSAPHAKPALQVPPSPQGAAQTLCPSTSTHAPPKHALASAQG